MLDGHFLTTLLAALAMPYALVLAVPGPNFLVLLHASLASSGRTALAAALGIASGATLAAATASCIAVLMPSSRVLEFCGVLIFSIFLLRAAVGMIRNSKPVNTLRDDYVAIAQNRGHFGLGLLVALFNPVTIPFFVSFFLGHPNLSTIEAAAACATVFVMAALWFGLLGLVFVRSTGLVPFRQASHWLRYGVAFGLIVSALLALSRLASGLGS